LTGAFFVGLASRERGDGMLVREAREADMTAITAIYGHSVLTEAGSFETVPPDGDEMTRRWRAMQESGFPYLVASTPAGTITGYACAGAYRPRPAYAASVECSVYVDDGYRRQGVGRLLVTALIAACQARGYAQMVAVIGDRENAGSIALHDALGFRHVGTLEKIGRKFDRWIDVVLMQKAL